MGEEHTSQLWQSSLKNFSGVSGPYLYLISKAHCKGS